MDCFIDRIIRGKLVLLSLVATLFLLPTKTEANFDVFLLSDIRLQGLQRVSAGTVFNELPVNIGDEIDSFVSGDIVRSLFNTGLFDDITVERDEEVLIISLNERPAIEAIEIDGNKAIKTEALLEGLGEQGLREGEIFKQATLERISLELERQYIAQGRYGSSILADVSDLPRNRVAIDIEIEEGKGSGIRHINIVGNSDFAERDLLPQFELEHRSLYGLFRGKDKYSREKLQGDIETLESFYQDQGYVEFEATSTQVSVTPDRRQVYVTINVDEGEQYTVREVDLIGELNEITPDSVRQLFLIKPGMLFSRALVTYTEERISNILGNAGYTFAEATGVPEVNEDGTVDVKFIVNTGQRAYVRRISFSGNGITQDEVLRREMRQIEGGWASTRLIDLSKVRLERLGYFQDVKVETPAVVGREDQIDVDFTVKEQPTGSISATIGYSGAIGLMLGGNYQQNNIGGSGNSLGLGLNWSDFIQSVNFNYFDPYFTPDQISRGYSTFFRKTNYSARNIARFSTDAIGVGVNFGFPISETEILRFGLKLEQTDLTEGVFAAEEIRNFIEKEGNDFLSWRLEGNWRRSTLNRGIFPTRGRSQVFTAEVSMPGSDLQYYSVEYADNAYYAVPMLSDSFALHLRTEIGYGDVYGSTETYPFFRHFFAGGFGSVRGYENSTLGPRSSPLEGDQLSYPEGDPFGGNLKFEISGEFIFPIPFLPNAQQIRPVVFLDAGNVFNTNCPEMSLNCFDFDAKYLRYSGGIAVSYLTGMGPMSFALTYPFNAKFGDEQERFSFEMGKTF